MPNAVKYKAGNLTGSIQKGNVALAVNDIVGPTSTTGWYNGPNFTQGTYQIIETAATGDPDIFCPQNDAELIKFVRWKGATGSNTGSVGAALAWIATQPNLLAVNEVYPNIVTSGSLLNLDAQFVGSYPTTESTWYDVSGNNNNGSLVNGPTFNNAGYITFDGIDDACNFPVRTFNTGSPQQGTFYIRMKFPTLNTGSPTILFYDGGASNNLIYLYRNPVFNVNHYSWLIYSTGSTGQGFYLQGTTYLPGRWYDTTFTFVNTGTGSIYRNGELINSSATVGGGNFISWNRTGNNAPALNPASALGTGSAQLFQWYNRALTQAEILQNYYQGPIVTDGLVLALDAGNLVSYESGSTTTYSMTGSLTGSLLNGVGYLPSYGGTWNFDGVDDYIEFPFETILNDCSFEVWFKATSTRTYQYPLAIRNNGVGSSYAFYLDINDPDGNGFAQTMWVYWNSGGTPYSVVPKTGTYGDWNDSTWRHYVFTRSTTVAPYTEHYMNGVKVTNVSRNGDQTTQFGNGTGYKLYLGQYGAGALYYPGYQAIVRIYNKTLSSAEVAQNYNATKGRFGL